MGIAASHPYEPVHYNKGNGVIFSKSPPGQPRDIVNRDVGRLRPARKRQLLSSGDWAAGVRENKENDIEYSGTMPEMDSFLETSYEDSGLNSFHNQESVSLKGNFSPGSLRERMLKAEEMMSQNQDSISSSSQRPSSLRLASCSLKRELSTDSFSFRSDSRADWSASRTFSIDSQVSESAPELQKQEAEEIGCVAVEKIEHLETELNDLKQTVIDLDAEFVNLKVYKRPPEKCWELTNISLSDSQSPGAEDSKDCSSNSRLLDVVEHYKTKMWYKGLLDNKRLKEAENEESRMGEDNEVRWDLVSRKLLDWDVEEDENEVDSGSDFGNSLETDSVEFEENSSAATAPSISLEWDLDGISEVDNAAAFHVGNNYKPSSDSSSSDPAKRKAHRRRRTITRKTSSIDNSAHSTVNRTGSTSCASDVLAEQIVRAIGIRNSDYSPMSHTSQGTSNQVSVSMTEYLQDDDLQFEKQDIMVSGKDKNEAKNITNTDSNGNESRAYSTGLPGKNSFRDSAYYDGSDFPDISSMEFIEDPINISSLIANSTDILAKGMEVLAKNMEVRLARRIRNDHYCPIRATVFHLLSKGHSLLQGYNGGATSIYQILTSAAHGSAPWLLQWSFGHNLPYIGESCLKGFWECLKSLEEMEETLKTIPDKESFLLEALKNSDNLDAKLNEAAKLLMVVSSFKLYEALQENNSSARADNGEVWMFSMLLYGREYSKTPRDLIMEHLDKIGNTLSLDQIGLHLLGISLCATIKVARPHLVETSDFIQICPDWKSNVWPEVLLATDDQNVWLLKR